MTQSKLTEKVPTSNSEPAYSGATARTDNWWVEPLLVAIVFTAFGIYATYRAFENQYYEFGPYLSPFYSPNMKEFFPDLPFSAALLILPFPLAFRATCYYYRKAYYRSYFAHPPGCAVTWFKRKGYTGEFEFPFNLQNLHRYAFYFAVPIVLILWYDALKTLWYDGGLHLSVLTLVMLANCALLSGYTFGCHACRHLVGGHLDSFSCPENKLSYHKWQRVTVLNEKHQEWAWTSLISVAITDIYIRMACTNPSLAFQLF